MSSANDMIVISEMDKETGLYDNILVSNFQRWNSDSVKLNSKLNEQSLVHVEIFRLGVPIFKKVYFSIEEFEAHEINV